MARQQHPEFGFRTQIRRSPYFDATLLWGTKGCSVHNHMYTPSDFGNPTQKFWNGVNTAMVCDVAMTFYFTNVQK
ncbi:MAG: hypothetical protein ACJAUL_003647 [Paraglaciecola sp.]|jgi:hypothetical protein